MTDRPIQSEPDYHDGFFDAQLGEGLWAGMPDAYREGWLAFHECKSLLDVGHKGTVRAEFASWERA